MAISIWNSSQVQTAQFSHANSGYAATTAGPTTNTFTFPASTSGYCYLSQQSLTSGSTVAVDLLSGGLKDLVGDVTNMSKLLSLQVVGQSGAVQMETYQSGGVFNLLSCQSGYPSSGYGQLTIQGESTQLAHGASGQYIPLGATATTGGNLVFRAVSGAAQFQCGFYGV